MAISNQIQGIAAGGMPNEDPRWQVVERIVASPSFQKSERLKAFLTYVVQQYLAGHPEKLTGHHIGIAVFGKDDSYDQSEDNTVRTHARQLRLRLLEYFDSFGREEPIVVEIPKGSYIPVFRPAHAPLDTGLAQLGTTSVVPAMQVVELSPPTVPSRPKRFLLGWIAAGVLLALTVAVTLRRGVPPLPASPAPLAWPFSALAANGQPVTIVLSDNSYALYQVAAHHRFHLGDYLKANYPANLNPFLEDLRSPALADFADQLGRKQLTSYADSAIVGALARTRLPSPWFVRPGRDIKMREVQDGNYVLLGSSYSNPWVELYESRLNFVLGPDAPLRILNRKPLPGESSTYIVQGVTGNIGDDYAAIAMIPNEKRGAVLLIQGAKEEGTEAAGLFIADPNACKLLQRRLGIKASDTDRTWFEALLKTRTLAGASASTEIVAVRRLSDAR